MIVGSPRELKDHEYRVGLTPAAAHALTTAGHSVLIEAGAGARVGFPDDAYRQAGAQIAADATELWSAAELVVKVKELQPPEFERVRRGQILFCYQHFAADPQLLDHMLASGATCIAFETVTSGSGTLPLLAPMSRIAGRLATQMGAWALGMANGGSGVLLGGVPGVPAAKVVVIGAGSVGANATQIAVGMGARVCVFDRDTSRLAALDQIYQGRIDTCAFDALTMATQIAESDLLIGAVLIPGRRSPQLITRQTLARMRPGSVLVDVGIDQGGISATSRPSSHSAPLYVEEGVLHYCVPNMPAICARTATLALAQATLPYTLALANQGLESALRSDPGLAAGLQICDGRINHAGLAEDTGRAVQSSHFPG